MTRHLLRWGKEDGNEYVNKPTYSLYSLACASLFQAQLCVKDRARSAVNAVFFSAKC